MSSVRFEMAPKFFGENLGSPIVLDKYVVIDGRTFVHITKQDRKVERLLISASSADARKMGRPLSRCDVIETILQARADKYIELIDEWRSSSGPTVSLGLNDGDHMTEREKRTQNHRFKQEMPKAVQLDAPSVGDVDGVQINVKLESHCKPPLIVELTQTSIDYLIKAVSWQLDNNSVRRKHPRKNDVLVCGLSRVFVGKHAGKFRFQFNDAAAKRCRVQFAADSADDAMDKARQILSEKGVSGDVGDVGNDEWGSDEEIEEIEEDDAP